MTLVEKMRIQPVYLEGDNGKYRTEYKDGLLVYKRTSEGEIAIPSTDNGFRSAMVYNGSEITEEEYRVS